MPTLVKPCIRVRKLQELAKSWGGEILELSEGDFAKINSTDAFQDCPFSSNDLGILWEEKKVVFSGKVVWTELVHEMGHVFACLEPPYSSDEYSFFGWEYAVAKMLRGVAPWKASNADYGLENKDFGTLPNQEKNELLKERFQAAKIAGLVNRQGLPKAIR